MNRYKMTNFVIVALVITAIYQTGELWLEGTSSHNFFYMVKEALFKEETEADGDVLLATRYAIGEGEGIFSVHYPDQIGTSAVVEIANKALRDILLENSTMPPKTTADWKKILQERCLVMQYDFMIASEEYLPHYAETKSGSQLEKFDYITIIPARHMGESSQAYFVNSDTNECIVFEADTGGSAKALYDVLEVEEGGMRYISTGQRTSASVLWRNLFLPQWAWLPYEYAPLVQEYAFEKEGKTSRSAVENTAKQFFRNFSVDWSEKDADGTFTFSDSETVVKYYPAERMLEYFSYENYGTEERTGLLEGYQISCNFLKNDTSLQTDIYLADVERTINNEIVYYFDYVVDDLPVHLSQPLRDHIGLKHAIEVTLRNQSVKEYRRYAANFTLANEKTERINVQFIDALDDANKTYQALVEDKDITDVKNISLGYYVDLTGEKRLKWFVTLYDYTFVVDTEQKRDLTGVSVGE